MADPLSPFQKQLTSEYNNRANVTTCGTALDTYVCFRPKHTPDVPHAGVQQDGSFVQWMDVTP